MRRAETTDDKTLDGRRLDDKTVGKSFSKNKKMNDGITQSAPFSPYPSRPEMKFKSNGI